MERLLFFFSYVFWFGDLNFRLTGETTTSPTDIRDLVLQDKLTELIEKDQLLLVRKQGKAFTELEERLPAFPPTFKFEHGTSEYDMKYVGGVVIGVISCVINDIGVIVVAQIDVDRLGRIVCCIKCQPIATRTLRWPPNRRLIAAIRVTISATTSQSPANLR